MITSPLLLRLIVNLAPRPLESSPHPHPKILLTALMGYLTGAEKQVE